MLSAGLFWVGVSEIAGDGCHAENFGWRQASLAEGEDGEGVVAFGQAGAVLVAEEMGLEISGSGEVESALEENLAGGGFEEVGSADDFGDAHGCVVDYGG